VYTFIGSVQVKVYLSECRGGISYAIWKLLSGGACGTWWHWGSGAAAIDYGAGWLG
jgi:hypothetical protein